MRKRVRMIVAAVLLFIASNLVAFTTDGWANGENDTVTNAQELQFQRIDNDTRNVRVRRGTATGAVEIPATVTVSGDSVPWNVTEVAEDAFRDHEALTNITIPASITNIGQSAFRGTSLTGSIVIPDNVTSIGNYSFGQITTSFTFTFPTNPAFTVISDMLFFNSTGLTEITIPSSVTTIGAAAFGNTSLTGSITIPDNVTTIEETAFSDITTAFNITLPNDLTDIPFGLFSNSKGLTAITIPNSVTTIERNAFFGTNLTGSIVIPDNVTTIGQRAFSTIQTEFTITLPNNSTFTVISENLFYGSAGLKEITIPNSVTTIENLAFRSTRLAGNIVIPDNVTSIGSGAFSHITTGFTITLPDNPLFTTISNELFNGSRGLTTMPTIPNSVTSIELRAFQDTRLEGSVVIPNSVTTIGWGAFNSIASVNIAYSSFTFTFPTNASFTQIPSNMFNGSSALTAVTIPDNVTHILDSVFNGTRLTGNIVIPSSVQSIENGTFRNITSNFNITLPDNPLFTTIAENLFFGSTGLTEITIPSSVTNIRPSAFQGSGLVNVVIPSSVETLGNAVFQGVASLRSIMIPASVTTVGQHVFHSSHADLRIYAEVEAQPDGWNAVPGFNHLDRPVIWGISTRSPSELALAGTELSWTAPDMAVTGATGTPEVDTIDPAHHATIFAGFRVYRDGNAVSALLPFNELTYTVSGARDYVVKTVFTTGNTSIPATLPHLPVTLTTPANAATNVILNPRLQWTNPTCPLREGFRVYLRAIDNAFEPGDVVATIDDDALATSWRDIDSHLLANTTYYWRVVPFGHGTEASANPVFSFTTMTLVTVSSFTATPTEDKEIKLDWTVSSVDGVQGFRTLRNTVNELDGAEDNWGTLTAFPSVTSYSRTDNTAVVNLKYYYWIEVHYANGFNHAYGPRDAIILPCDCGDCEECEDRNPLSVSMSTFSASVTGANAVSINWTTASESGIRGFHVFRGEGDFSEAARITPSLISATNTAIATSYQFTDNSVNRGGEYFYWIQSIANDGSVTLHGPMSVKVTTPCMEIVVPLFTAISGVYPNPVRTSANFDINVKEGETATLRVFNVRGQIVREFTDIRTGAHNIVWDRKDNSGREVGSGVYFYRFTSPSVDTVQRMVVVR